MPNFQQFFRNRNKKYQEVENGFKQFQKQYDQIYGQRSGKSKFFVREEYVR